MHWKFGFEYLTNIKLLFSLMQHFKQLIFSIEIKQDPIVRMWLVTLNHLFIRINSALCLRVDY
jgi:hypothetical protein